MLWNKNSDFTHTRSTHNLFLPHFADNIQVYNFPLLDSPGAGQFFFWFDFFDRRAYVR